jgi:hypothetical protein
MIKPREKAMSENREKPDSKRDRDRQVSRQRKRQIEDTIC